MNKSILGLVGLFILMIVTSSSVFVVQEYEDALLLRLGKIVDSNYEPGLYFKMPVIQNVKKFDNRIQTLDAQPQRFLTSEKKFVVVDSFVKWRISDVAQYYRSTSGNIGTTSRLLSERINSALRDSFGKKTITEVISGKREEIMADISAVSSSLSEDLGVDVVDVRIKQIDFPPEISSRVYERMRTERERVARELRAEGAEAAERITAAADRKRTETLAEAYRESETIRGEGDADSASIYAGAFNQDKEFYSFWRSLEAYENVFADGSSLMVLDPDSDFFRYFKDSKGL